MTDWRIEVGDCRDVLRQMPTGSVHTVVTSPPFYGLRDYGVDGQLGLESTPDEFVAALVDVFREVRRVLRDDGTVWLNLGDSYAGSYGNQGRKPERGTQRPINGEMLTPVLDGRYPNGGSGTGAIPPGADYKAKDLLGIPWLVAFALRADGWVLRQEIVWKKPNPMPESVTDRCTKSHEQIFMFSKASWSGSEPGEFAHISEEDARWLALFFDAEGSLVLRREREGARHAAQISLGSTCRPLLEAAQSIVGAGNILERPGQNAPMHYWQLSNKRARDLLVRLYPHLIVKQRQARCLIDLESRKWYRGDNRNGLAPSEIAYRERLWAAVKSLNSFGDPDVSWVPEPKIGRWGAGPRYFYDADAIRESAQDWGERDRQGPLYDGTVGPQNGHNGLRSMDFAATGRNKRSVWTVATQPYAGAHFACADEATDCLTAEGWKRHDELWPGMLAAQFDMESQTLSWAPIQEIARYDVTDQEMVVGQRRDMSMVLTPNHRCVIQRRHPRTRQHQSPTIVRADELLPSHTIPTAAPWASSDGDTSLSCEWAELLGWYIAEGYESQQALAVELYQSEDTNPAKVARIESLLRQVGAEWTAARTRGQVAFRVIGYAALRLRELAPAKRIPPSALLWSQDRITALLDGLIDGDGHRRPDGRMSFIQKDSERAGMVQALALRLGLSAHLTRRPDGINTVYLTKHRTRSFRGTAGQGAPLGRMRYSGVVWCPRLPAGTWVARRDGKPFITGNTFPPKLIEPCILAGAPERACGECGAPWERVVERELEATERKPPPNKGRVVPRSDDQDKAAHMTHDGWVPNRKLTIRTLGFEPSCSHGDGSARGVVLDPFAGAGTTGLVALQHGRDFIGIELSPEYARIARERIETAVRLGFRSPQNGGAQLAGQLDIFGDTA